MTIAAPDRLIDDADGSVWLRLVPFHLERLHGQRPDADIETATALGLPFPLLNGEAPIDVQLRAGMTPGAVGPRAHFERNSSLDDESWWRWAAYAITPFGWAKWPVPIFTSDRLSSVKLQRHGPSQTENFDEMLACLRRELGAPTHESRQRGTRSAGGAPSALWERDWGRVLLYLEPRDGIAEIGIAWGRRGRSSGSVDRDAPA